MTAVEIFMWWLDLDLASKEWLRENLRATKFPWLCCRGSPRPADPVRMTSAAVLTAADWDFIETQSEFVD